MIRSPRFLSALLLITVSLGSACGPGDPVAAAQRERARWDLELLSWIPRDDGTIRLTVRVTGPPNSKLETLTFRIIQLDAAGEELAAEWKSIDLANVPRGAPKELSISVGAAGEAVDGLTTNLVLNPTPEQIGQIPELQAD